MVSQRKGDLILARVDTPADLNAALTKAADQLESGVPIWFIYRKGPGHPLNENHVRDHCVGHGESSTQKSRRFRLSSPLCAL